MQSNRQSNQQSNRFSAPLLFFIGTVLLAGVAGCKPDYPACGTDKDCKEKEFCVDRKCQQCRENGDCREGTQCSAGACKAIPGFCKDASQCTPGQLCVGNRCQGCDNDGQCAVGQKCLSGLCRKPQCMKDDDCAQNQECRDSTCVAAAPLPPAGPPCPLATVYFGFNESTLSKESQGTLSENVACLKKANRPVNLTGRADPRGTMEYNMALSDRRAQAVKDYLQRFGVESGRLRPVPRGALDASGSDEATWAKDRRVDSEWQ